MSTAVTPPLASLEYLQLALDHARKCVPTPTAFCVGCVIVAFVSINDTSTPIVLSTGFSRELEGNTHAEANALEKARQLSEEDIGRLISEQLPSSNLTTIPTIDALLRSSDVYTTLEPCSVRLSGLSPCADALIEAQVKRCIIGVGEPDDFVKCEGARKLSDAGIDVIWMRDIEEECLAVARTGHDSK
ncbi:diaminohydroxyphosphoribosylamino-pyrimidine deaminase [Clavulina sp. PMI_390]|nr:diaminohydroxyphosphoribosylamino-pyrimidine deaminase [Clavulina sp. PMI_390]